MVTNVSLQTLSMADTPPPLPAPLKEGDEGPPVGIYALSGPATDDREVGVARGCGPATGDREYQYNSMVYKERCPGYGCHG